MEERNERQLNRDLILSRKRFHGELFGAPKTKALTPEESMMENNLRFLPNIAAIVFVFNLFWIILDVIFKGRFRIVSSGTLPVLVIQILYSLLMIFLPKLKGLLNVKEFRISFLLYFYCTLLSILAITVSNNVMMMSPNYTGELVTVSIGTFYLFIFVFMPFYRKSDSLLLAIGCILELVLPYVLPGHVSYRLLSPLLLHIGMAIAYLLYRRKCIDTALERIETARNLELQLDEIHTDLLTDSLNQNALRQYLTLLERNREISTVGVLLIDVDDFMKYNDSYTYEVGDEALERVADAVSKVFDEKMPYLFRYSGDEFIAFVKNADEESLLAYGESIREAVWNESIPRDDLNYASRVTVSVGCALLEKGEDFHKEFVTRADYELSLAKKNHKNCLSYAGQIYREGIATEPQKTEKPTALIVDDVDFNRMLLIDILGDSFNVIESSGGRDALQILKERPDEISIMLLDIMMPDISGLDVLKQMHELGLEGRVPVLVITGDTNPETERACLSFDVADFITKPFNDLLVNIRIRNALERQRYKNMLEGTINSQLQTLFEQNQKLTRMNENITTILGAVVEGRDSDSGQHVQRVKAYTRIISRLVHEKYPEYHLTPHQISLIVSASPLHDIGKVMIPDAVLLKPGKLTNDEFELMKTHTVRGCDILTSMSDSWDEEYLKVCLEICRSHHEKYDGKGYPDKLVGDEIPISAQIVSIADCFDALTQDRVYKKAFSVEVAYEMILGGECGAFSPAVLDCFRQAESEMKETLLEYKE